MKKNKVLVTGGLGYIGSHTCIKMLEQGIQPVVLDNLSNSSLKVIDRIKNITGKELIFINGDIRDETLLDSIFSSNDFYSVIHFAGLKSVGESVRKPIEYYDNNVVGTLNLIKSMQGANVKKIIFSSSATVYGEPSDIPLTESSQVGGTTNPYGSSKYMVEGILTDLYKSCEEWSITLLRYFNPVGAHSSGLIGEDPQGIPNNLAPFIAQVAIGRHHEVKIFGNDYATIDGTGVRDYIHVMDLASGHIAALNKVSHKPGLHVYNLGTGKGTSVLEMINAFEVASGAKIPYTIVERRAGDIAECWSSPAKALNELNWKAQLTLQEMVQDSWRWQLMNPNGFK